MRCQQRIDLGPERVPCRLSPSPTETRPGLFLRHAGNVARPGPFCYGERRGRLGTSFGPFRLAAAVEPARSAVWAGEN